MNKIDQIILDNDLNKFFIFDSSNHKIAFNSEMKSQFIKNYPHYEHFLSTEGMLIESIDSLVQNKYPFIQSPSLSVIEQIILRNEKIKELTKQSIKARNTSEIKFTNFSENDKAIIQAAKSLTHDINKFVYKNKISRCYVDTIFINENYKVPYISKIDLLCRNEKQLFLCLFKFSKTPYTEKYVFESELIKKVIEKKYKLKIDQVNIFNVYAQQVIQKL